MKTDILGMDGKKQGSIDLPEQFNEDYRPDLIRRAVLSIQSHKRQPYGTMPEAGKRPSAKTSKRRRQYRGSYGKGISRVPRKVHSRNGSQMNWVGAFAPGTVGGYAAHPPKSWRVWDLKINDKERKKALRSAIAATAMKEVVSARGHKSAHVPLVADTKIESISKTSEAKKLVESLGLKGELVRCEDNKVRAGKGKNRGRKYKTKKGVLFVVSGKCHLLDAAKNLPGVDIAIVSSLNAELLAPGYLPGRITVWSEKAIERLAKEKLFLK